jgi:hypothetical protein
MAFREASVWAVCRSACGGWLHGAGEPAYAFSMAKRGTTRTKTAQLRCADVPDFTGVAWVRLYHVPAIFALITRKSSVQNPTREQILVRMGRVATEDAGLRGPQFST